MMRASLLSTCAGLVGHFPVLADASGSKVLASDVAYDMTWTKPDATSGLMMLS